VAVAFPDLTSFPQVSGVALLGSVVALLGGLCSPPAASPYAAARAVPLRSEVAA
jgi:hypothetical protein